MKLNQKKFLKTDESIVNFSSRDDLEKYLTFRKKNDEWLENFITNLSCYGIENLPLFIPGRCKDICIKKGAYKVEVEDIDYDISSNMECIEAMGLFLIIPYQNKMVPFPTRPLAYTTICQRADLMCGTMARFDEKNNKMVLSIEEKAEWLTRAFQLYGDSSKALYRDGKISALLSKDYQILPADELIGTLEGELKTIHNGLKFEDGMVSHEYLVVRYSLNDASVEESLRLKLNDYGADVKKLTAGVQFYTSDVGMSAVNVNVTLDLDGKRIILGGLSMPHKGDASIEKFSEILVDFGLILQESEERIEQLGNIDINDVAAVVKKITDNYPSVFPKGSSEQVISELNGNGTGIDVFIALNDIVNRHVLANPVTPTRYLNMTEQVYNLIKLPFDKIESGEYILKK